MYGKVGIITATVGGRPKRLSRSVNSVKGAEYEGEVVHYLVQDGPTEQDFADEIKERVDHIILRGERGGPGAARNSGIVEALKEGCDYIRIIDDDDWTAPDALPFMVSSIEDVDVVYGDLTIYNMESDGSGGWKAKSGGPQFSRDWTGWGSMRERPYIPLPACLFKADFFNEYGMFREDLGKCVDWELLARAEANGAAFKHLTRVVGFAEWRWGPGTDNYCSTREPEDTFPPTSWARIRTLVGGHYI